MRLITLGNSLETWENKMNVTMHGGSVLLDREWMNFYELINQEWSAIIDSAIGLCIESLMILFNYVY